MYDDLSQLTDNNVSVEIITNDVAKGANPWGCTDYLNEKEINGHSYYYCNCCCCRI
jgi:putative cardiolipin synthase